MKIGRMPQRNKKKGTSERYYVLKDLLLMTEKSDERVAEERVAEYGRSGTEASRNGFGRYGIAAIFVMHARSRMSKVHGSEDIIVPESMKAVKLSTAHGKTKTRKSEREIVETYHQTCSRSKPPTLQQKGTI